MVNHPNRAIPIGAGVKLPDGTLAKRVNLGGQPRGMIGVVVPPDETKLCVPRRSVRYIAATYAEALEWQANEVAERIQGKRRREQSPDE